MKKFTFSNCSVICYKGTVNPKTTFCVVRGVDNMQIMTFLTVLKDEKAARLTRRIAEIRGYIH